MTETEVLAFIHAGGLVRGVVRPYRGPSYFARHSALRAVNVTRHVNALVRKGLVKIDYFGITPGYHQVVAAETAIVAMKAAAAKANEEAAR